LWGSGESGSDGGSRKRKTPPLTPKRGEFVFALMTPATSPRRMNNRTEAKERLSTFKIIHHGLSGYVRGRMGLRGETVVRRRKDETWRMERRKDETRATKEA